MWTTENRPQYERKGLRYPTDLTDAEWALVKPLIPRAKRGGRRREVVVRDVLNGILYVLSTACQWRALPKDLPPRSTVHGYLQRWDYDGTMMKIHDVLYVACREQAEREASPTACVIDSQSVKSAEKLESLGFAQNFLSSCELEALHFIGIGSFGEEFREDVVFRGIQEQFRKPLA
jgi:transposase